MQHAILFQAYGGTAFVNECRYALLKYLQVYNLKPPPATGIVIYTDQPNLFSDFEPFFPHLSCRLLTAETIRDWKGPHNFVHRIKIKMMMDFFQRFGGSLLYCDTDTYVADFLEPVFSDLETGQFYMHTYEGTIDKKKFPQFHKWEKFLSETPVSYNDKQVRFSNTLKMFNAGVLGLHANNKDVLPDVLALTDSIYAKFPKHVAEQFAFGYCFQQRGDIKTADHLISHYWDLKEFRQLLDRFFTRNMEESIPTLVKKVHHLNAFPIMQEKTAHKQLPFLQRLWKDVSGKGWRIERYERPV